MAPRARSARECHGSLIFQWYPVLGLNQRHFACKANALATELTGLDNFFVVLV